MTIQATAVTRTTRNTSSSYRPAPSAKTSIWPCPRASAARIARVVAPAAGSVVASCAHGSEPSMAQLAELCDMSIDEMSKLEQADLTKLNAHQAKEGRVAKTTQAMDREGHRHQVTVHVCASANGEYPPEREYVQMMVAGGRHWHLPAGWVASLEEHLADA